MNRFLCSEFFTNENTAIVWGETYDVSTEKHVLSNEQITLQSTRFTSMSASLQTTRNDSVAMDISSAMPSAPVVEEKKPARPSILRKPFSEDQKENVMVNDDASMELSLVMQPPTKPPPSKSLFSMPSLNSSARAAPFKPSLFNFSRKSEASATTAAAEKTSGSDNMDISGIEPTLPTDELEIKPAKTISTYLDFLKQNNLIAKPKSATNTRRQTVNQSEDMQLDKSLVSASLPAARPSKLPLKSNSRKTIIEPHEMSMDNDIKSNAQTQIPVANGQKTRRETIVEPQGMQLDTSQMIESPIVQPRDWPPQPQPKSVSQSDKRKSIHEPTDMSFEKNNSNCAQLSDISIEFLASELPNRQTRRQSTHKTQDISLDTPTFGMNPRQMTENLAVDMSLDTIKCSPLIQPGISNKAAQPPNRMTINEAREMSFDSTTKTAAQTYSNKTIFGDMSMDLQYTGAFKQTPRKSVICKSPSKNSTRVFDQSDAFELTRGIELNPMQISYHPLHLTRLNDENCSRFNDIDFNTSIQSTKVENNSFHSGSDIDETFVGQKKNEVPVKEPVKQVQIFNQTKQRTLHETCNLDMSEDSPIPTSKKYNLNKTPFYFGIDKENDPALIETMNASDLSLDLTNNGNDYNQLTEFKQDPIDARRGTVLFHASIQDDSKLDEANRTNTLPIEISDSSIVVEPQEKMVSAAALLDTKRRTCFQELSMAVEPVPAIEQKNLTQSLFQITPIKDDSIEQKPPTRVEANKRLTIINNEPIELDETPLDFRNISNGLEESKQRSLTFIADDDDEDDQLCNTKIDLVASLESSDIDDFVERKYESITNRSYNVSKLSLHSDIGMPSMHSENDFPMKDLDQTSPNEPLPQLTDTLKINELNAFKKSNRLRHSNVFERNTSAEMNQSEPTVNEEAPGKNIAMEPIKYAPTKPVKWISMAPISRSSIMQRRSGSIGSNNSANETSYLSKSMADKPLSEIKIDFSGYEKLEGLATVQDVFQDFCSRMNQIRAKAKQQEEERNKFARGEIDSIDPFNDNNNNDDDLVSQNVEAPSWTFLFRNKMKWEE